MKHEAQVQAIIDLIAAAAPEAEEDEQERSIASKLGEVMGGAQTEFMTSYRLAKAIGVQAKKDLKSAPAKAAIRLASATMIAKLMLSRK